MRRANVGGSSVEDLVTSYGSPSGIALDLAGGKVCWVDGGNHKIQRANVDGTEVESIIANRITRLDGIALDPRRQKLYWTEQFVRPDSAPGICRANPDGSNIEHRMTTSASGFGIALDFE